jgi:predicted nucleic acid-binding protein
VSATVDASVAIKWVFEEQQHEAALGWAGSGRILHAPSFILTETANVIWRKWRQDRLDAQVGERALLQVAEIFDHIHRSEDLLQSAMTLACELDHPVHDCLYLACAMRERTTLITADQRLYRVVGGTRLAGRVELLS